MDAALKAWTHSAYGLLQSLWLSRAIRLGNVGRLQQNIADLCSALPSNLGFESRVSIKSARPNSIRVDDQSEDDVVASASRATIDLLLIGLVVVFDEVASDLMASGAHPQKDMPGQKAEWLRTQLPTARQWAAHGVTELIAIRNVLIHGKRTWSDKAIKMLREAGVTSLPAVGAVVEPGVDDLFRYRRAVRTALNEIRQLPSRGAQQKDKPRRW